MHFDCDFFQQDHRSYCFRLQNHGLYCTVQAQLLACSPFISVRVLACSPFISARVLACSPFISVRVLACSPFISVRVLACSPFFSVRVLACSPFISVRVLACSPFISVRVLACSPFICQSWWHHWQSQLHSFPCTNRSSVQLSSLTDWIVGRDMRNNSAEFQFFSCRRPLWAVLAWAEAH